MKLHYSQTINSGRVFARWFYYLMKLHYSQTCLHRKSKGVTVLLPYEITLFSNEPRLRQEDLGVLLPYEITLFSNKTTVSKYITKVLLPYEITLFSNNYD